MIDSIEKYMRLLSEAMKNADSATRQDAMADAEDHLRAALADELVRSPGMSESDLLPDIIEGYGTPQETGEAYREQEEKLPTGEGLSLSDKKSPKSTAGRFFSIFGDSRAWGAVLYCILSLGTGVLYFSWAVTGIAFSASMMILIVGIPVAMAFFFSFHGLAFFEGRIVEGLLGERMPRRKRFFKPDMSWGEKIKRLLLGKDTWSVVLYQLMMLPIGIVYFTLAVTLISLSGALIASPLAELIFQAVPSINTGEIVFVMPRWTLPLFSLLGLLLLKGTLHLFRKIGPAQGRLAKKMLVSGDYYGN